MKTSLSKKPKRLKNITRQDQESKGTHGWHVRVRHLGKTHSKFFSDKKCGGTDVSFNAAIAWCNEVETRIGKKRTTRSVASVKNLRTGVVGVRLDNVRNLYKVTWVKPDGKKGSTTVSIRKHGKKAAFSRACKIREEKNAERLAAKRQKKLDFLNSLESNKEPAKQHRIIPYQEIPSMSDPDQGIMKVKGGLVIL